MLLVRRKSGDLTPLELSVLAFAREEQGFWGYQYASAHPDIPNGTIYRTIARLERFGYLRSTGSATFQNGAPPRKMYVVTPTAIAMEHSVGVVKTNMWSGRLGARAL